MQRRIIDTLLNEQEAQEIATEIRRIEKILKETTAHQKQMSDRQKEVHDKYTSVILSQDPDKLEKIYQLAKERLSNMFVQAQIISDQIQAVEDDKKVTLRQMILVQRGESNSDQEENLSYVASHLTLLLQKETVFCEQREKMLGFIEQQRKVVAGIAEKKKKLLQEKIIQFQEKKLDGVLSKAQLQMQQEPGNAQVWVQSQVQQQGAQSVQSQQIPGQQVQSQIQQIQLDMLCEGVAGKGQQQSQIQTTANQLSNSKPSSTLFQNRSQIRSRSK